MKYLFLLALTLGCQGQTKWLPACREGAIRIKSDGMTSKFYVDGKECDPNAPPKAKKSVRNSDAPNTFHANYNGKDMLCDKPVGDMTCCFVSEDGKRGEECKDSDAAKPSGVVIEGDCDHQDAKGRCVSGTLSNYIPIEADRIDVPAIEPKREVGACCSNCDNLPKCQHLFEKAHCADKTRILQHDEQQPPTYWCHKPQP